MPLTVVVSGAAGAIGSATVRAFIDAGFYVVGLDRAAAVKSVASGSYTGLEVDLEDEAAVSEAVDAAAATGPLAHLVGIAGGALPEEPRTQDDPLNVPTALFRSSLEANLVTQYRLLRLALPALRRLPNTDRSISLTSSFNALSGWGMPAYSAAKAGMIGMMYALVGPLGADGIRINVVAPGTVRTPRTERIWGHVAGHFERLEATTALGRLSSPEDVARTFLALATLLRNVTGHVLVADAGQTAKRM
jgi:meso-butanediol dehydrogenase/(S,S)-butanediol dehydrogenase/diacetyl reductase